MKYKIEKRMWPKKDWLVSDLMLDLTLDEILKKVKIDRSFDIPYLAGYSKDGKKIYIDRHMPKSFKYNGIRVDTDRFLILHESIEKALIDALNLHYQYAHQIALRTEQAAVRSENISWTAYNNFMKVYIKEIGDERLTLVPKDLDLKPYQDEHDERLLKKISQVQK